MNALFADTFYWIALTDLTDSAHQLALAHTSKRTDAKPSLTPNVFWKTLAFMSFRRVGNHFSTAWLSTEHGLTKDTVWSIAFPCRRWARKS
jgi:hypothetical protein